MKESRLYLIGFILLIVGFALLVIGSAGTSSASFGGVVFIGPFPIVFGSGPQAGTLALIALVIGLAIVVSLYLSILLSRKRSSSSSNT